MQLVVSRRKLMNASCCGEIFAASVFRQVNPVLTLFIHRMNVAHERRQVTSDGSRGATFSGDHAAVVDSLWGPRRRGSTVSGDHAADDIPNVSVRC